MSDAFIVCRDPGFSWIVAPGMSCLMPTSVTPYLCKPVRKRQRMNANAEHSSRRSHKTQLDDRLYQQTDQRRLNEGSIDVTFPASCLREEAKYIWVACRMYSRGKWRVTESRTSNLQWWTTNLNDRPVGLKSGTEEQQTISRVLSDTA